MGAKARSWFLGKWTGYEMLGKYSDGRKFELWINPESDLFGGTIYDREGQIQSVTTGQPTQQALYAWLTEHQQY